MQIPSCRAPRRTRVLLGVWPNLSLELLVAPDCRAVALDHRAVPHMAADFEAEKNGLPPVPPSNYKNRVIARCRRERPRAAMERAVARGRDSTVCKRAFRQIKHTASRARAHRWLPASAAQSPLRVGPASSCSAPHIASRREHEHPGKEGKDKNQSILDTVQVLHENISKRIMISTTRPPALCTAGAR